MPTRLFVAKLPLDTSDKELKDFFSSIGSVTGVILPVDRETGKRRGFAFVDFQDKSDADKAIRELNNQIFKGSRIAVSEARPREEGRSPGRSSPPRGGLSRPHGTRDADRFAPSSDSDFEGRRPRRSPGGGKKKSKRAFGKETRPRGPIPERRSGRFYDIGEDDHGDDVEVDDVSHDEPASDEDLEK